MMGVIIWKTKHTNMKGIIILLACVYWTVDCYPLADGVGLSHGSSQTAQTHHSSHGVLATPRAQPAPHHASLEFLVDMDILVVLAVDMTVAIAVDMRKVIAVEVMDMMRSLIHSSL